MFKWNLVRKGQASAYTEDLLLLVGSARALLLSMVLLFETLHPGLHHSHFPAVRIKVGTSAEHLVADSLPTLTVKNNLIIELNPVRPRVYIQNPRARPPLKPWPSPPALVCTSNSDMDVTRKSSSLGDPCPLFS